ncbi:MAG: glycosyltransferase [Nitrospirae bacterium]|nr:MAG: glycosyltransferase [Nitrospirota bacterium]
MPGSPPAVSVIMNCLNAEPYLREAMDSVVAQTYPDWEIVFWDNASQDNSGEIAKSYGGRVRCFRGDVTVPLGQARNLAIAEAKGRYLAILDCDDVWLPEKLERQIALLERDPSVGLVFSDCQFMDSSGTFQGTFFQRVPPRAGDPYLALLSGPNFIPGPTVVMRADAVRKVGAYNAAFRYVESYELFLRLARAYGVTHLDELLARYRLHGTNQAGAGHAGMTTELMQVIRESVAQIDAPARSARWAIEKRLLLLRCKRLLQIAKGQT